MDNRILLAVDDSPASKATVDYLAEWLKGTPCSVSVVHVLPHSPVSAVAAAAGGSSKPGRAEHWLAMSRDQAQPILIEAVERLKRDGMDPGSIDDAFIYLHSEMTGADGLLAFAKEHGCSTIVVGRSALPWHRELFHHHMADELIRNSKGYTVWVVE
jgi:nucleotide-binding universal stress UspA family protein